MHGYIKKSHARLCKPENNLQETWSTYICGTKHFPILPAQSEKYTVKKSVWIDFEIAEEGITPKCLFKKIYSL